MPELLLIGLFLGLTVLGIPVAVSLGISAITVIFLFGLGSSIIAQNFYASLASFPLLAIPFFILAGVILKKAELARKIADLFSALVGGRTGGMALVAILTSIFWGSVSGSGPATTAAVGLILISSMVKQGYDPHFAAAAIATSADLSIIIPPSIAFIIYGTITGTSVGKLFIAGIIPGLLTGLFMLVTAYLIARKRNYRGLDTGKKFNFRMVIDAVPALLAPVIILGGIYTGIFTPTEAAVVAAFYALFISIFIYRSMNLAAMTEALIETAVLSSVIMLIVALAGLFSWTASVIGMVETVSGLIMTVSARPLLVIMLVNLVVLALGMILDAISIMYIIVPMVLPVLEKCHIDPVRFGVIFVCGLAIGQATPPVGVNLFTAAGLVDGNLEKIAKEAIPFVAAAVMALIIISLFPQLSLVLL